MKKVSIVVVCRNEAGYIGKCLDSIIAQDHPSEKLEVLVCDGQSEDDTVSIIKQYNQQHSFIKLLDNHRQTTQHGLNLGIQNSSGDVVIILGAHAELYPDYISKCLAEFDRLEPKVACVGGVLDNIYQNERSKAIGLAMSSRFGVGNAHFRTGTKSGYVDTVAFGAYKKKVFDKVGLFDVDLVRNQDDEFNFRLKKAAYLIYLSDKIKAKYYVRASYRKLWRQYNQYGYWKVYVNKKHKTVTTLRQLIPACFVLVVLFGPPAYFISSKLFLIWGIIMGFYLLAAVTVSIKLAKISAHHVLISFLILHLSYGLGYLEGIYNFLILNRGPKQKSFELTR